MREKLDQLVSCIGQVLYGKESQVRLALTCLVANGHLLIEDLPGMGKTTLAHALAKALGMDYQRIQFTSDQPTNDRLAIEAVEQWMSTKILN